MKIQVITDYYSVNGNNNGMYDNYYLIDNINIKTPRFLLQA